MLVQPKFGDFVGKWYLFFDVMLHINLISYFLIFNKKYFHDSITTWINTTGPHKAKINNNEMRSTFWAREDFSPTTTNGTFALPADMKTNPTVFV